jgi:amino acid adenylation domain-containing protein
MITGNNTVMCIQDFIYSLREQQVKLSLIDDKLSVKAPGKKLSSDLIEEIKNRKEEIITYLKQATSDTSLSNGRLQSKEKHASVVPVEEQEYYSISYAQRRLWIIEQLKDGQGVYNMPHNLDFDGLERPAFEKAIQALFQRHEILRTRFITVEGEQKQQVIDVEHATLPITYIDLRNDEDIAAGVAREKQADAGKPFDLVNGPLIRVTLLHLDATKYLVIVNLHHIIFDGWSKDVLFADFNALYQYYLGQTDKLPAPLQVHYKDYTAWQLAQLNNGIWKKSSQYWHKQFDQPAPELSLVTDHNRPATRSFDGGGVNFLLEEDIYKELLKSCHDNGTTLFMTLIAATKVLLHRYTGKEDIVIGTPIAGRDRSELEDQIGFYVNTLTLRTRFNRNDSFEQLTAKVKETTLGAYEHQQYPYDLLVEESGLTRDMSRTPLFDVMAVWYNNNSNRIDTSNYAKGGVTVEQDVLCRFDLTFNYTECANTVLVDINYCRLLFSNERMVKMALHLKQLLKEIIQHPGTAIAALDYLEEKEKKQLTGQYNDRKTIYPYHKTVPQLFEEQAVKTPEATAVVYDKERLTYRELSERSSQVCNSLQTNYGIKPGDLVGLMTDRSLNFIVTILGILKAGAAYLPLDTTYPPERLKYMLDDGHTPLLISEESYRHLWEGWQDEQRRIVCIDELIAASNLFSEVNTGTDYTANSAAYVMYTSGSTGRPKGVVVNHRGIVRLVKNTDYTDPGVNDKLLQTGSLSFDATTFEFYSVLLNGGELHLMSSADLLNTQKLKDKLVNDGITMMWLTSSWLNQLVEEDIDMFSGLRYLATGGERLSPRHIKQLRERFPSLTLVNGYGPTENTTFSICKKIDKVYEEDIPLGKPINNSTVYILDDQLGIVPEGVTGEIYLGGDGLADGYLNEPELTAEKFIDNPYKAGEKLYRSGDTGCWLPGGEVRFISRKDNQVKIRGYRIEPGEIESVLASHEAINRAVVVIKELAEAGKFLVAYYSGTEMEEEELKGYIAGRLPSYMVPRHIFYLSSMPLTVNGKIDRNKLPDIETNKKTLVPPTTRAEEKLVTIWKEVLRQEEIGITDNFFELGGHSLKATQVLAKIYKEFTVQVTLNEIFDNPTIKELAALLSQSESVSYESIEPVEEQDHYTISNAQQRLWIVEQFDEAKSVYNIPNSIFFEKLDRKIFEKSIRTIIERHEILRTVFVTVGGWPRQQVKAMEDLGFFVNYIDLRHHPKQEEQVRRYKDKEEFHVFDLAKGPLVRVTLLHLYDSAYRMLINFHHIVSDGWSAELLKKEFISIYEANLAGNDEALQPLALHYKDFSCWQRNMLENGSWNTHRQYWHEQLADLPTLELATDYQRPSQRTYEGAATGFVLDTDSNERLQQVCEKQSATPFMALLACVKLLLFKHTGQEDIVTGTITAGREMPELQDQLGFYVNTLTLRTRFNGEDSFGDLLKKIKKGTLEAYSHQQYPFDVLVDELNYSRSPNRSPLFDVMVDMQNFGDAHVIKGMPVFGEPYVFHSTSVKFDLNFTFIETTSGILINASYNTGLFSQYKMEKMLNHLVQLLNAATKDVDTPLSKLEYLTENEMHELLHTFNNVEAGDPPAKTLIQLFEEQVQQDPDNISLLTKYRQYTFREVNEKANQLANYLLQTHKITKGEYIGVLMKQTENRILVLLAILKAGGVYVPIDLEYPLSRVEYILKDTAVKVLFTDNMPVPVPDSYKGDIVKVSKDCKEFAKQEKTNPLRVDDPADMLCILYTSGSTGIPKGVYIINDGIVNRIDWFWKKFSFGKNDVIYQKTCYVFDVSMGEIFMPLAYGAKLLVAEHNSAVEICENIQKYNVSYIHFSPTFLNNFLVGADDASLEKVKSLRYVCCSGEALLKEIANKFHARLSVPLVNMYGPTETSIEVSWFETSKDDEVIPIGKPMANVQLYVLDKYENILPIGVPGEIAIGGVAVSTGYLNQVEKTKEKFIDDPFIPGHRRLLYKTGDIGKWNTKGEIEFLGRRDNQISINGLRIELGEIESTMLSHSRIAEGAIGFRKNKANQYQLIAYYVKKKAETTDVSGDEKKQVVTENEWNIIDRLNGNRRANPAGKLIHLLVEWAAADYPDHTAIICGDTTLTYRELIEKTNQLAHFIRKTYRCQPGDRAAIWMTRSEKMIIALLAASKLGLTYVPVDPEYPVERVNTILEDATATLLITDKNDMPVAISAKQIVNYAYAEKTTSDNVYNDFPVIASSQPVYIMYTSGSTGKPKGVVVSHDAVMDYVYTFTDYFGITYTDTIIQQASLSFDTSIEEIFPVLGAGGKLVIMPAGGRDADAIVETCIRHGATVLSTTPLVINEINNHDDREKLSLRVLISGGDALKASYIDNLFGRVKLYNTYGPTEATVCASFGLVDDPADCDTIGFPITNHQVYLLDDEMKEVGFGKKGEIYIGGNGLAIGYLNRETETANAFVQNPFDKESRLYKTGDVAIRLEDGRLQFIGRKDRQVKIRGYRVEPGEVEKEISRVPGIDNVCVVARNNSAGSKQLIGFYTAKAGIENDALRQQLHQMMPAYMVPAYLVPVDTFPVTANGKIDYAALPIPAELIIDLDFITDLKEHLKQRLPVYMIPGVYIELEKLPKTVTGKIDRKKIEAIPIQDPDASRSIPPRNDIEKKIAAIWIKILRKEKIGITDNFFELGGNSLKATQIITRIYQEWEVNVSLNALFNDPTIEGLAEIIKKQVKMHTVIEQTTTEKSYYPVSYAQRRLWVIEQFEEAKGAYNMPLSFDFDSLDRRAFDKAIYALLERHEILRTTFAMVGGEPVQKIWATEDLNFDIEYTDLRNEADAMAAARTLTDKDEYESFDLVNGPLLRVKLLQITDENYKVILNQHHIISDGWSINVLQQEFAVLYECFLLGKPISLPPLPIQYKDYTLWQKEQFDKGDWDHHRKYWHGQLAGKLPVLELPADYPRPVQKKYQGSEVTFLLEPEITKKLQNICQQNGASFFMGVLAAANILLYRYTGQEDIIIGSPIAGRNKIELEDQLGFYVNTLALRAQFSGNDDFITLLNKIKQVTLGAYEHQEYPFDLLVDELNLERDLTRSPLFDIMILHDQVDDAIPYDEDICTKHNVVSKFDLTFTFTKSTESMSAGIVYSTHLFSEQRITRMAGHLKQLLTRIAETPALRIKDVDYLTAKENIQLLYDFNGPKIGYPSKKTIHKLIEEQSYKTPRAIAVKHEDRELTYAALNERANQLAHYLREKQGIVRNDVIGVMVSRTEQLPVILTAILKAGAAYLPLDPDYPLSRLSFMSADASIRAIIVNDAVEANDELKQLAASFPVINYDKEEKEIRNYPAENPESIAGPGDIAYLIYTSGTTGKPKGVCLTHQNAVALISWAKREFAASDFETVFATTSYCFDLSVYEIFYSLASGKQLRVLQNAMELGKWLIKERNILVNTVPSVVQTLLQQQVDLRNISVLNIAGEPIPAAVIEKLDVQHTEVRNLYGPSEYATYSTCYRFEPGKKTILIGKPLDNTQVYILDDNLKMVPVGSKGEIYIAGEQLSRGYLNRQDLTTERFISNPFEAGKKLYKTGDIGYWQEDGNIFYIGRKDNQVKLRGYRIELGEIESVLATCNGVQQVAVVIRTLEDGDSHLVAYYTGKSAETSYFKNYLKEKLPYYMVPDAFIHLQEFPLSPNGKIDRSKLPDPVLAPKQETYLAPSTEVERKLVTIWQDVLKRNKIGITDNFFEIGGQSLKAMQIVSRVNTDLQATITIKEIFNYPVIQKLAAIIDNNHAPHSSMIRLNKETADTANVFFIPPILGLSTIYRNLAEKLEGKMNCYGLLYSIGNGSPAYHSIEEMGKGFADEIGKITSDEDIVIVGYSMGALVGFEITKELERRKRKVKLVMLDRNVKGAVANLLANTSPQELDNIFKEELSPWLAHIDAKDIESFRKLFAHHLGLIADYTPKGRVEADMLVAEAQNGKIKTAMYEWEQYTFGNFKHIYLSGTHAEVLAGINQQKIIELLFPATQEVHEPAFS